MRYRQLGASDLEVSEISLGSWLTYGVGVEREQAQACVDRAFDARDQLHRHRQRLRARRGRGVPRRGARRPAARLVRARDQALLPDVRRGPRAVARADPTSSSTRRCERLRTDYVDLYQCHRYDADTPLEETMEALTEVVRLGQGALHRVQRVDGRADPGGARPAGRRAVRLEPAAVLDAVRAMPEARGDPALRGERDLADRLVAARAGRADRQVPPGRGAAGRLARQSDDDGRAMGALPHRRGARRRSSGCARSRTGSGSRWRSSRSRGCCASRTSRRRSSAPRGPSRSTTNAGGVGGRARRGDARRDRRGARLRATAANIS